MRQPGATNAVLATFDTPTRNLFSVVISPVTSLITDYQSATVTIVRDSRP